MCSRITAQTITLADNRKLGYSIYGDPGGFPMLFFHGWPGTRLDISCLTSIRELDRWKCTSSAVALLSTLINKV